MNVDDWAEEAGDDRAPLAPTSRRRRPGRQPRTFHFSLGAALARSFTTFGRTFPVLVFVALLIQLPVILWQLHVGERLFLSPEQEIFRELGVSYWGRLAAEGGALAQILVLVLPYLLNAAVTLAVFQHLSGSRVQYGRSIGQGASRLLSVLGIVILTALLFIAVLVVPTMLFAAIFRETGSGALLLLVTIGVMAVLAIVMCVLYVSVQAAVVEKIGSARAMGRSAWLTRGARWKIFAIVLVLYVIGYVVQMLVMKGVGENPASWSAARTGILVQNVVLAILMLFGAVTTAVVYHDLRKAKEGVGLDELIRVFD